MRTTIPASNSSIRYSPADAWAPGTSNGTITTSITGATAQFSFDGESLKVFGIIPESSNVSSQLISTYTLDGASPVTFNATNLLRPSTLESRQAGRRSFFRSEHLANGSHSLVITTMSEQINFILDSIEFDSGDESDLGKMPLSKSDVPEGHTHTATTSVPSSTPSVSVTGSTTISRPVIPVLTIVVTVFAALLILIVGGFFSIYRRYYRRKKVPFFKNNPESAYESSISEVGITSDAGTRDSRYNSFVTLIPNAQDPGMSIEPASSPTVWGSITPSVSTASAVVGDRTDGRESAISLPTPVTAASNHRPDTVVSDGSQATWDTGGSDPPPSWSGLSDGPPSYTSK